MTYPRQSSLWKSDGTRRQFYVYIMSNKSMTLYIGVTNDLDRRIAEHKAGECAFTSRYHFDRLVYYESFDLILDAIAREKQIKGMDPLKEDRADQSRESEVDRPLVTLSEAKGLKLRSLSSFAVFATQDDVRCDACWMDLTMLT